MIFRKSSSSQFPIHLSTFKCHPLFFPRAWAISGQDGTRMASHGIESTRDDARIVLNWPIPIPKLT